MWITIFIEGVSKTHIPPKLYGVDTRSCKIPSNQSLMKKQIWTEDILPHPLSSFLNIPS